MDFSLEKPDIDCDGWCETSAPRDVKYTYIWTIKGFSKRAELNGAKLSSEAFTVNIPGKGVSQWRLNVYPMGWTSKEEGHVSVYLKNIDVKDDRVGIKTKFQISILDVNKKKVNVNGPYEYHVYDKKNPEWGYAKFIKNEALKLMANQYLPEDKLTIIYDVFIHVGNEKVDCGPKNKDHTSLENGVDLLLEDFKSSFDDPNSGDVEITCGKKSFLCHESILSARSPVFKTMFQSKMTEATQRIVKIDDFEEDVMGSLLRYIYTGSSPDISKHAQALLSAADKYDLPHLKRLCEESLIASLNVTNVANILVLADLHQAEKLKQKALAFIVKNPKVMGTEEWTVLMLSPSNQSLLFSVTAAFANN